MKRICFISTNQWNYVQGGAEYQISLMARYLVDHGYEVHHIFVCDQSNDVTDSIDGVKLHPIQKKYKSIFGSCFIQYALQVWMLAKKIQPDAFIHRDLSSLFLPIIFFNAFKTKTTILHIAHEKDVSNKRIALSPRYIFNTLERCAINYILKNVGKIVAQAEYQSALLARNYNRTATAIIRNMHPFPSGTPIKSPRFKVVWVANLKPWKRPEMFIDLAKRLKDYDIEFHMVGRASNGNWCDTVMRDIKSTSNVFYHGELSIDETNSLIAESHLFVNTSENEGFPNTYIQSWMRGVPVLAVSVDPDDCIKNNELGKVSVSVNRMANDLIAYFNNRPELEKCANKCMQYAFERHSLKNLESLIGLL